MRTRSGVLAWEPGVGKTFAAIMAGVEVGGPQLYLCPSNLRNQVADAAAVYDPSIRVQIVEDSSTVLKAGADITICSYNAVTGRRRKTLNAKGEPAIKQDLRVFKQLFKKEWGSIALDEGHGLKEADSQRTRAVYGAVTDSPGALFRRAKFTWVLTGTPVLASPLDLWTHYSRLFPFALTDDRGDPLTQEEWIDRFCQVRKTGFGDKIVGGKNYDELNAALNPFMHVLKSVDVLGLELPTIDTLTIEPDALLKVGVHPDAEAQIKRCLDDGGDELPDLEDSLATERRLIALGKVRGVLEQAITELEGGVNKIVIFGHHTEALTELTGILNIRGFPAVLYRGGMTQKQKDAAKAKFIEEPKARVMVINIAAGGTGLDGLQAVARRLLFLEADWTPGINDQAIRRLWRSGQKDHVHASFCSLRGSVDEAVQTALTRKARTIAKIKPR